MKSLEMRRLHPHGLTAQATGAVLTATSWSNIADFLARVLKEITPLRPLQLALLEAVDAVLAESLQSRQSIPCYDTAQLDGYAVVTSAVRSASESTPVALPVIGDIAIGSWQAQRLPVGASCTIVKGAPIPAGADAVIPREWTDNGLVSVTVYRAPRKEQGIVRTGTIRGAGDPLVRTGSRLTPATLGLIASAGFDHVPARPRPRVIVAAVGAEYVEPGQSVGIGHSSDSASFVITAGARQMEAQAFRISALGDDPERIRATLIDNAMRADLLVTTGDTRLVAEVLGDIELAQLPILPEGEIGFGRLGADNTPLMCLPGEPGAAYIWFELLVRPIVRRLFGHQQVFRPSAKATVSEPITSPEGKREFRPAIVTERRGGGNTVRALDSGIRLVESLTSANALMVLSDQVGTVPAGASVDVMLLDRD